VSLPQPIPKPLLCYVTDRWSLADTPELARKRQLEKIEDAAKARVDWIQIREKDLSGRELTHFALEALQRAAGRCAILINDRLDVARAVRAGGVHLGERSLPVDEARRLFSQRGEGKDFLVGASAHSLEGARRAEQAGADYVIFGPVYATPSKENFGPPQGLQRLRELCGQVRIPVLAIGGISMANARDCLAAGAVGIAAIRLFQEADDLSTTVRSLRP
jgi:thiamine-phosphate pyrophosphorylase